MAILPAERVLGGDDVADDARERLVGPRERQQVGMVGAAPRRPREVLRHQRGLDPIRQRAQSRRCVRVGRRVGGQRQRDAVQADGWRARIASSQREPRAAVDQVVLGMDLEPQPRRRAGERVVVVLGLQAEPGGERGHHEVVQRAFSSSPASASPCPSAS